MPRRSRPDLLDAWQRSVNVLPDALTDWLDTAESASVGTRAPGASRSVGQLAGEQTLHLLDVGPDAWSEADWQHAARTVGFVRRHRAQWPAGDLTTRRWRHALRNWGHDPLWAERLGPVTVSPGAHALLVDDEPVGELGLESTGATVDVVHLHLAEAWRGRGLGSAVLHGVLKISGGAASARLEAEDLSLAAGLQRRGWAVLHQGPDGAELFCAWR